MSCPELAREAVARRIAPALSASTVRRWLGRDAIRPWQHHSWIFISDPDFRPKAARVRLACRSRKEQRHATHVPTWGTQPQ
ncbi:hypothetical protein OG252_19395 [Streptomyces sp. NBC_01352]|uniref:hypothetical protein n=1 Tax=Streptomyces sp. NBC_01352 TaxID=2903834 RepID=UPI002E367260|nr:hypothetical protein [Streptomyces sp. NBC_01352]